MLTEIGNTVLVVEHDKDIMFASDYLIDLGPGGGDAGGEVVAEGPPERIMACERSETGRYLKMRFGSDKAQQGKE